MKRWMIAILIVTVIVAFWFVLITGNRIVNDTIQRHRTFVYCTLIKEGMSQEEVKNELLKIGSFTETDYTRYVDNLTRTRIDFTDPLINFITGHYAVIGYKDDQVVTRYATISLSDHLLICDEDIEEVYGKTE